jgi:transcriptional regulator with XRE-family HTH domain
MVIAAVVDLAAIFGDNLSRARRAADLSQDELARLCGVHRTEISQLERGLRLPRVDTLAKLCAALEVDPAVLIEGIVWRPPRIDHGSFEAPAAKDQ